MSTQSRKIVLRSYAAMWRLYRLSVPRYAAECLTMAKTLRDERNRALAIR